MINGAGTADLIRLVGLMSVGVGIAWAVQIVGFPVGTAVSRLMWVLAAASFSGAGVGLILTASSLGGGEEAATVRA